jgi:hypothetical protein
MKPPSHGSPRARTCARSSQYYMGRSRDSEPARVGVRLLRSLRRGPRVPAAPHNRHVRRSTAESDGRIAVTQIEVEPPSTNFCAGVHDGVDAVVPAFEAAYLNHRTDRHERGVGSSNALRDFRSRSCSCTRAIRRGSKRYALPRHDRVARLWTGSRLWRRMNPSCAARRNYEQHPGKRGPQTTS